MTQEFIKHRQRYYINSENKKTGIINNSLKPYTLFFFLPLVLLGSYWYIKNWVLYGNPVYPMEVKILNATLFNGLFDKMRDPLPGLIENANYLTRLFHVWMERAEFYLYDSRLSGLGPIWAMVFLPSLIFALIYAVLKKHYDWLFISILLIITFLVHPRNWTSRYTIFMVMLGAISFGFVIDYFKRRNLIIRIATLILAVYTVIMVNSLCVLPEKIKEFINLPPAERSIDRHQPFNIHIHVNQEYGYWKWISKNINTGDTLAYTFEPLFMTPLWNDGFSNRIIYIDADTYENWLFKLSSNEVTYVLLKQHSKASDWLENLLSKQSDHADLNRMKAREYVTVYADEFYKIAKVVRIKEG